MDLGDLATLTNTEPSEDEIAATMLEKRQRSVIRRRAQSQIRQRLKDGIIDFPGLLVQAIFDKDAQSMRIIIALTALPRIDRSRAETIMTEARLPLTRRLGWLASHPKSVELLNKALARQLELLNPAPRQLPNPNWPWRDDV